MLMPISRIKLNPKNPRLIRDDRFEKLKKSLKEFPKMLEARPIVVDENNMILGGNMRFRAAKELGWKEIPVKVITGLTDKQKREFMIKDNAAYGEWDWEMLSNEWDAETLSEFGLNITPVQIDVELPEESSEEKKEPKITDKGFVLLEVVMEEEKKIFVVDVLSEIKKAMGVSTGDALYHVFKTFKEYGK